MQATGLLESLSPWGSRSATPRNNLAPAPPGSADTSGAPSPGLSRQQGGDHRVSNRHRISPKDYPEDCPPLNVRWFYATDVAKRKPSGFPKTPAETEKAKAVPEPKKYAPFTARDSRSIELAFQQLADAQDGLPDQTANPKVENAAGSRREGSVGEVGDRPNTSLQDASAGGTVRTGTVKVPVNEDFLFDVDIDARELAPAYWLGPVYDVRRATWFYAEGSGTRPCNENLASQLEEGYLKSRPWNYEPVPASAPRSSSATRSRPSSWMFMDPARLKPASLDPGADRTENSAEGESESTQEAKPDLLAPDAAAAATASTAVGNASSSKFQLQTHRLFGAHMNSIVTYQDATVAWLLTDDFLSRMSSTVYQRFAGGGHLGGIKLVRGYAEAGKKDTRAEGNKQTQSEETERGRGSREHKRNRSAPPAVDSTSNADDDVPASPTESLSKRADLEKKISGIVGSATQVDPATEAEQVRQKEEQEIREDYQNQDGNAQDREIEHLVLVTHGIGQRLGMKLESLNFIHDVNVFRKTLKGMYEKSPDLQALNLEVDKLPKNCRIQVLPVVWRHLLDFPNQTFKDNKEKDLSDASDFSSEFGYPSLKDITIEGVPSIRNLVEDLFLDILLYQSEYREHIVRIVQRESNRIYRLFCERNPTFHGKVSLVGHSLGSAICFELLCRQKDSPAMVQSSIHRQRSKSQRKSSAKQSAEDPSNWQLDFEVEDFYCLGSPIGLFQMLKGKSISGRRPVAGSTPSKTDPFSARSSSASDPLDSATTSSPRCAQLYNIFHPTDPVAYRIEPLISPAMKDLKPQPLPYVKKGIFGVPTQGLSGIGMRVGQSVSGLWSSMTTGVASSLLNRSLGLQAVPAQASSETSRQPLGFLGDQGGSRSRGASVGGTDGSAAAAASADGSSTDDVEHPPTLIDQELETLYSGFQRQRHSGPAAGSSGSADKDASPDGAEWREADERARQLRREEAKVRALNANGRVDYSIQEGVFDISLIGSIASHLSYWSDEDINHFVISQLLARQRVIKR